MAEGNARSRLDQYGTDAPAVGRSGTGLSAKPALRRSRAACSLCRWRKVRCDSDKGRACSNCIFEKVDCVIPQRQARRKPYARSSYPGPPTPAAQSSNIHHGRCPASGQLFTEDQQGSNNSTPTALDTPPREACNSESQTNDPGRQIDWYAAATKSVPAPVAQDDPSTISVDTQTFPDPRGPRHIQELPPYAKPIPLHLSGDDLEYLRRKGALQLPEPGLRDELLRNYVQFVHPCLPILDLDAFQTSLQDDSPRISLLVLQAVMYASGAWADTKLVRRSGYLTRQSMRKAFYLRAKMLYDLGYEKDRLAIVQALTIFTIWWDGPGEQKDGYYWCSVALAVARSIGLHRDVHNRDLAPPIQKLRRRIWWSCMMRDTITSIGANRAPRIKTSDFDVPMLSPEDFTIQEPESTPTPWAASRDATSQRQLISICVAMTKLCRVVSSVLELAYDENSIGHTGILYPKEGGEVNIPSPTTAEIEKLATCEEELRQWREEVPANALHQGPAPDVSLPHEQAPYVHSAVLSMLYFMAMFSIHRACVLAGQSKMESNSDDRQRSQSLMRFAAASTNNIAMELYKADLMRSLPVTGISCILAISFSHVFDLKSPDKEIRCAGTRRLEECKLVLRELVDSHLAAEWAIKFLTFAESHVARSSKMCRRPNGASDGSNRTDMQAMEIDTAHQDPRPAVQNELSTLESSANGLSSWQPLEAIAEDNGGLDKNDCLLLPDDNLDFLSLPDMWSRIGTPFESFNTTNFDGGFDSFP